MESGVVERWWGLGTEQPEASYWASILWVCDEQLSLHEVKMKCVLKCVLYLMALARAFLRL